MENPDSIIKAMEDKLQEAIQTRRPLVLTRLEKELLSRLEDFSATVKGNLSGIHKAHSIEEFILNVKPEWTTASELIKKVRAQVKP